ncbi:tRNA-specific 2-thiouridylase MnmA [compost metagenome]
MVEFAELQWAATPGQSVVIYESQVCLGGGIIETAERVGEVESQSAECPPGAVAS